MNGETLRYLADVADLARLDLDAAALTLSLSRRRFMARYSGAYARGYRQYTVEPKDAGEFEISVSANRFKTLAGMFADTESVTVEPQEGGLSLRAPNFRAELATWGEAGDPPEVDRKALEFTATLNADELISEIDSASEFTADSYLRQALTGLWLEFKPKTLIIRAFDGFGALYESKIEAEITGKGVMVVPTDDFRQGARLIGSGKVVIGKPQGEDAVVLYKLREADDVKDARKTALFRSSIYATDWPDIGPIMKPRDPVAEFTVERTQVRNLITSAKVLETGPDIDLRPRGKNNIEFSAQSEAGRFTATVKGNLPNAIKYDRDAIAKVLTLGLQLDFAIPSKPNEPTLVTADQRRCWIVTRV